jgi:hypothetical protein
MATGTIERRKLTAPQIARLWGVSTHKVLHFIRTGELRAINLAASRTNRPRYVIDRDDLERFERGRQVIPDGGESTTRKLRRRAAGNVKEFF